MILVIVGLVAVVLLVLVVVALGMRSMNRRESALPAERLREMAEKEASTPTRSIDEFAAREPKMDHFTPDLSPFDEPKPRPRPSGARGKRGVNEFGEPDDYDEDYWEKLQADDGGFGGSLSPKVGADRPVDRPEHQTAGVDADAVTVQAPLPSRSRPKETPPAPVPAAASAASVAAASPDLGDLSDLGDLVEPVRPEPAPSAASLAEQKTVTFAAPTPGAFGEGRAARSGSRGSRRSSRAAAAASAAPAAAPGTAGGLTSGGGSSRPDVLGDPLSTSYPHGGASPAAPGSPLGPLAGEPAMAPMGPTTSGGFPAMPMPPAPAASSVPDPLAAPYGAAPASDNPWAQATTPGSGGWAAVNTADILDDPAPSYGSYQNPVYDAAPATPSSYEVSAGWAVIEDDVLTGPSPAVSTPTGPSRAVSPYDHPAAAPSGSATGGEYGYETGQYVSPANPVAWPEPAPSAGPATGPAPTGAAGAGSGSWPSYGELYGTGAPSAAVEGHGRPGSRGSHHRNQDQDQDYPDYYR
ncbi:hypothetical protein ACFOWE_32905 [Planomonospora corallina]|uniref:Uncharacterized protein n=1 Tax=Planomonospora corallina TaxID=1806052 RepID=A0ABV8IFT9_9ACTN